MKLDENYSVNNDGTQWVLSFEKPTGEIHPKTKKEIISRNQWYYNNLRHSIASYIDKKLKDVDTVDETILELKRLLDEVEEKLKMNITK